LRKRALRRTVRVLLRAALLRLAVSKKHKGIYAMTIFSALTRVVRDDKGSQATEIALGIVLIALVAGIGMVQFGDSLADFFQKTAVQIDGASPNGVPTPVNNSYP
jgi:Flp pilus assembly pilin Flp